MQVSDKHIEELKKCELWEGSILQLKIQYSRLTYRELEIKRSSLYRCTDRTRKETEFLTAITKVLNDG